MGSSLFVTWAWFTAALAGAELHHSGYDILPSWDHEPRFHDLHHERFNCNYGLLGVFDLLHGTDEYTPGHKRSVAAVFSGLLARAPPRTPTVGGRDGGGRAPGNVDAEAAAG